MFPHCIPLDSFSPTLGLVKFFLSGLRTYINSCVLAKASPSDKHGGNQPAVCPSVGLLLPQCFLIGCLFFAQPTQGDLFPFLTSLLFSSLTSSYGAFPATLSFLQNLVMMVLCLSVFYQLPTFCTIKESHPAQDRKNYEED